MTNAGYPSTAHNRAVDERRIARIGADLSALRLCRVGNHANGCVPVLLRVQELQDTASSEPRRLLRVLFVRFGQVSTDSGTAGLLRLTCLLSPAAGGGPAARISVRVRVGKAQRD